MQPLRVYLAVFKTCLNIQPKEMPLEFFGLIFSKSGIRPWPKKVQALREMQRPETVSEVKITARDGTVFFPVHTQLRRANNPITRIDTPG